MEKLEHLNRHLTLKEIYDIYYSRVEYEESANHCLHLFNCSDCLRVVPNIDEEMFWNTVFEELIAYSKDDSFSFEIFLNNIKNKVINFFKRFST